MIWVPIIISLSTLFYAKEAFPFSHCEQAFIFSNVFKNGRNDSLKESMQELQFQLNEVEALVKSHVIGKVVANVEYQKGLYAAQRLVEISTDYLAAYNTHYAPTRILTKPLEEWESYLRMYRGMYVGLNKIFEKIYMDLMDNSKKDQQLRNFQKSNEALLELQRLAPLAHLRF